MTEIEKQVKEIDATLTNYSELVSLSVTQAQIADRITELQYELEDLYEQSRRIMIEHNELSGKVII